MNFVLNTLALLLFLWLPSGEQEHDSFVKSYEKRMIISGNKTIATYKVLIQINNSKGKNLGEIRIGYDKDNKIKNLKGKVLGAWGNEVKVLKPNDIKDRNYIEGSDHYTDHMIKEFTLMHDSYPYFVEYSYSYTFDQFIFENWTPLYRNSYTERASLILETPFDFELNTYEFGLAPAVKESEENSLKKYTWTTTKVEPVEKENYGPSKYEQRPSVYIVPKTFYYAGLGSSESWSKYGDWVYALGENCNDLNEEQVQEIKEITNGIENKKDIVKILYNRLQDDTRYVNVSLNVGGMVPYPASYVADNNYGDCKALTYYMKSMLEVLDIESYPVDVNWSNSPVKIKKEIPTQQFNHIFLCVPVGNDTLWLENTSNSQPFNYIDTDKQGELGLLIQKNGSELIQLPQMGYKDVHEARSFELTLDFGQLNGTLDARYKGRKFESMSYIKKNFSVPDQKSWMKRNFPVQSADLDTWELIRNNRNDRHISFKAKFDLSRKVKKYGNVTAIYVPEFSLPRLEKPEERKTDLRFRIPVFYSDTINFYVDRENYDHIDIQSSDSIDSRFGNYQIQFHDTGDSIVCIKSLQIPANELRPGRDYHEFFDFISKVRSLENQSYIVLKK